VAAVFPTVADDATYANLIPQISSQLQQITALLNSGTLNSAQFATLQGYLTNLTTLQAQLAPLSPSPNTAVQLHDQLNGILAIDLPQVTAAIVAQGNAQLTAASLASNQADPASFYRQIESAGAFRLAAAQAPAALMYGDARHTQLVELLVVGFEEEVDAMELIENVYGPILHQLGRMTALMALNGLTQQYLDSLQIDGMITGASQSFQAFGVPGSLIEIEGSFGTSRPDLYNTWLIGSDQIAAAEDIINSFNPSKIKTIDDLWDFFKGIIDAVNAGGESAEAAHQNPDGALPEGSGSCFFAGSNCIDLTWSNGFKSVQTKNVLAIGNVLVLVKSPDGGWSTGQFDFAGQ
jgi:hypothetical protein